MGVAEYEFLKEQVLDNIIKLNVTVSEVSATFKAHEERDEERHSLQMARLDKIEQDIQEIQSDAEVTDQRYVDSLRKQIEKHEKIEEDSKFKRWDTVSKVMMLVIGMMLTVMGGAIAHAMGVK